MTTQASPLLITQDLLAAAVRANTLYGVADLIVAGLIFALATVCILGFIQYARREQCKLDGDDIGGMITVATIAALLCCGPLWNGVHRLAAPARYVRDLTIQYADEDQPAERDLLSGGNRPVVLAPGLSFSPTQNTQERP